MGGYHLVYALYQDGLKKEMKAYIKSNKSNKIASHFEFIASRGNISDKDFFWEEENKEFRYQNELYDVVEINYAAGRVQITCLKDHDENQLEFNLNAIRKAQKSGPDKNNPNLIKILSGFCFEKQTYFFIHPFQEKIRKIYSKADQALLFPEIITPPPRC